MFATIGRFADRFRLPLLIGWIGVAVLVTLLAPNLDDVTDNDQTNFLPDDANSLRAQALIEEHFPASVQQGSAVLVFDAGPGNLITAPQNTAFIDSVSRWLASPDGPDHVIRVLSPTLNPEAAGTLIAADGQVGMVVISLDTGEFEERADALDAIGKRLDTAPDGLAAYRTGEAAIGREYNDTITESVDRTIFVTLALVIFILLAIYRSPVSPLIPLFVVTIAFMIARGLVAWLAQSVFTVSDTAVMLLIVVMYGAGTDYCLFLISRFREEMADRDDSRAAVRSTVRHVGESISSSAGTVITGFMAMALAQLGLFNTTGPTLAIGVIVSLLAGLTLTPALLGLLGQRAFWPGQAVHRSAGSLYKRTSEWVSSRPLLTILGIVIVMAPFAYWGSGMSVTYDFLADLPDDTESVAGFRVLEEHIGAGEMQPLTTVAVFENGDLPGNVEALTREFAAIEGVAAVRSASQPLGPDERYTAGVMQIDHQLRLIAAILTPDATVQGEPSPEQQAMFQSLMADLPAYLVQVAEAAPAVTTTSEFAAAQDSLISLAGGGGAAPMAFDPAQLAANLVALADAAPVAYLLPSDLPGGVLAVMGGESLAGLVQSYLNPATNAARFEIVLVDEPYSLTAMDTVDRVSDVLEGVGGDTGIQGSTAVNADIRHFLEIDQRLTFGLVLGGIFIILLVMLRSVVAPLYLIGTILLSYGTTLGITRIASSVLWGTDELTWWVPFFMFVFLVALGIDYSIFLFGRIKEEVGRRGTHDGIHHAVETTGSIITSAGIIVAGTFGAMMVGDILGLAQIGFAVSVGILIDTFVVRTVLDPALAAFFGRWTWWPGGVAAQASSDDEDCVTDDCLDGERNEHTGGRRRTQDLEPATGTD